MLEKDHSQAAEPTGISHFHRSILVENDELVVTGNLGMLWSALRTAVTREKTHGLSPSSR